MSDLSIHKIPEIPIDVYTIGHVLASSTLTDAQKIQFIRRNSDEIKGIMEIELGSEDFNKIMDNRPLMLFKPIRNSFTKQGDRVLLAKTLEIPVNEMDDFVKKATRALPDGDEMKLYTKNQLNAIKTYVYRHGSQEQVIKFMDYELSNSKNIKNTLRKTLEYSNGGVADYFSRPIHRMKNETLLGLFAVINKNLEIAYNSGNLTEGEFVQISKAALARIYQLQSNSKFINAIKRRNAEDKK